MPPVNESGTQGRGTGQADQTPPFQMPDKFQGKSTEDVARAYVELEREYGKRNDYDTLKTRVMELEPQADLLGKYQEALQAWEQYRPALEKIGWDTAKLAQAATPQQSPDFLTQRLAKYGEILDAPEQARYLLNELIVPLYQADQQRIMQGISGALKQAIDGHESTIRQREKLLFSMLKRALPDVGWDDIYNNAMKVAEQASKGFDPFELDRAQEETRKRIEAEAQKKYEQMYNDKVRELENKRHMAVTGTTKASAAAVKPGSLAERRAEAMRRLKTVAPDL